MGGVSGWPLVVVLMLVVMAILAGLWCWWTAGRLDRMHLRVEAARASLDGQLQHRASVATELAIGGLGDPASAVVLLDAAREARESEHNDEPEHWLVESELTGVLLALDLPSPGEEPLMLELISAGRRAALARRIHNDVAVNTRRLHQRRRVRWFHLAGRAVAPAMIDFDDRYDFAGTGPPVSS